MAGVGFRILPTEEELLELLVNKVAGDPLPIEGVVIERQIYGTNATPWILFGEEDESVAWQEVVENCKPIESEKVLYVFTRLSYVGKKKTEKWSDNKKQKNRVAGCGTWRNNSAPEEVYGDYDVEKKNGVIGFRKNFTFRPKKGVAPPQGHWIMDEYSLPDCEDYVLCRIKRIHKKTASAAALPPSLKRKMEFSWVGDHQDQQQQQQSCSSSGFKKRRSENAIQQQPINEENGMMNNAVDDDDDTATVYQEYYHHQTTTSDAFLGGLDQIESVSITPPTFQQIEPAATTENEEEEQVHDDLNGYIQYLEQELLSGDLLINAPTLEAQEGCGFSSRFQDFMTSFAPMLDCSS